jgi:phosphonate transport system substrate-binding protein
MSSYRLNFPVFLSVLLLLQPVSAESIPESSVARQESLSPGKATLVIGRVSSNPKKHYKRLKGMVDYAVSRLGDQGISKAKILFARDNSQMIRYLNEGRVDWVSESVFSAQCFMELAGAEPFLLRWKKNAREYRSVFFVRKDSGIRNLEDLAGKKIAFGDAGSTTSFLLPAAVLRKTGMALVRLETPNTPVPENTAGYFSTEGSEASIALAVYTGRVQAGAFSNQDWDSMSDTPAPVKNELEIIYKSAFIPRRLELFRKGLDEKVRQALMKILLTAHENPEGQKALSAYDSTNRFEKMTPEIWKSLEQAQDLVKFILPELESK